MGKEELEKVNKGVSFLSKSFTVQGSEKNIVIARRKSRVMRGFFFKRWNKLKHAYSLMKNFFNREENMLHWGMGELLEQCS